MVGRLAKLRQLSWAERRLLSKAWVYVAVARAALAVLPFPTVMAKAAAGRTPTRRRDPVLVARTKRLVDIAAERHVVPMRCLPRSLALQRLLADQGIATELKIGVSKEGDALSAHAWLESDGEPLGEPEGISARYATLVGADRDSTDDA